MGDDKLNFKAFNHLLAIAEPGNERLTRLLVDRVQQDQRSGSAAYASALERMGAMLALGELSQPSVSADSKACSCAAVPAAAIHAAVVCLRDPVAIVRGA